MAQFETTGGGYIDSGDRKVVRKVFVSTGGAAVNVPAVSDEGYPLSSVNATEEASGVRRAVAEYSQGGAGGASYNVYGKRVELAGGTREISIYNHPTFSSLLPDQIQAVQTAVENKIQGPWPTEAQEKLFSFLVRQIVYVLAPSVVGRITEIESRLPVLTPIAKVANPSELKAPANTFWICTAITASPIGNRYEVTREYTLSFSGWDAVETLYDW